MNRESPPSRLEKSALKVAQKAMQREGGRVPSAEAFGRMRMQTASTWSRLLLAGLGVLLGILGIVVWNQDLAWLAPVFAFASFTAFIIAIVGRKKRVEDALTTIDMISVLECLIDL